MSSATSSNNSSVTVSDNEMSDSENLERKLAARNDNDESNQYTSVPTSHMEPMPVSSRGEVRGGMKEGNEKKGDAELPTSLLTGNFVSLILPKSFITFQQRAGIRAVAHVDCAAYFEAIALAMEKATKEIFVTCWFLTP